MISPLSLAPPKVGILLPSKNDGEFIGSTLIALLQEIDLYQSLGGNVELCCINDGSTDDTAAVITRHLYTCRAPHRFINRSENWGVTRSLEQGFQTLSADCDVVLRCDADACFFTNGWLYLMTTFLLSDDRIGVVSPIVLKPAGYIDNFGISVFPNGESFNELGAYYCANDHAAIREVDTTFGVYSMMRRSDWNLDTGYFLWVEDEDQGLILRQRGKKNFVLGNLPVLHFQDYRQGRTAIARESAEDFRVAHPIRRESLAHFEKKWGFSALKPDMEIVRQRYAGTELLWSENDAQKKAGEEIIRNFENQILRGDPAGTLSSAPIHRWASEQIVQLQRQNTKCARMEIALQESIIKNQKLTLAIERLKEKMEARTR